MKVIRVNIVIKLDANTLDIAEEMVTDYIIENGLRKTREDLRHLIQEMRVSFLTSNETILEL